MHEAPDFEAITLPAKRLAAAWGAVFNAAGTDTDDWQTYRAVAIEVFPGEGVRLATVNDARSLLIRAFVPELRLIDEDGDAFYDEPAVDAAPHVTVVVRDLDKRVTGLMKFLLTAKPVDKDDDDSSADMWGVTLAPGRVKPDGQPTLSDLFDEWGVVFTAPRSQECIPALGEMDRFPQAGWRHVDEWFIPGAVDVIRFSPSNLSAVAAVPSDGVTWQMGTSPTSAIRLSWNHPIAGLVHGLLMPMRPARDDTPTPDDDARVDADEIVARGRATRVREVQIASNDDPGKVRPELKVTITRGESAALADAAVDLPRGNYQPDDGPPFDADEDGTDWFAQLNQTPPEAT